MVMMILLWAYVLVVLPTSHAALHPISPCPSVFTYEGSQPENERWYGVVLLNTDESLVGVRIDVKLDRPAEILVSWMGKVSTEDNERYTILSLDQKLHPGPPIPSRFMVKFNAVKGSPQVRTIRLNGRQICPPDPNFTTDLQANAHDHLYENKYTTERVTRRPDLDFDDDPPDPVRGSSTKYSSHETGYGSQGSKNTGSSVNSQTDAYDSHESYSRRPNNTSQQPGAGGQGYQSNPRPQGSENTHHSGAGASPSINININKDVSYSVDRPDPLSYNTNGNRETNSRPSSNINPEYTNSQYPKTTERYEPNSGGSRDEFNPKTTKKPVVINSININIHSLDADKQSEGGSQRTTTRRPPPYDNKHVSSSGNSNRQTTRGPTVSSNQRPSSSSGSGYSSNQPSRNPEIDNHRQTDYGQSGYDERTTEKSRQPVYNQGGYNERTTEKSRQPVYSQGGYDERTTEKSRQPVYNQGGYDERTTEKSRQPVYNSQGGYNSERTTEKTYQSNQGSSSYPSNQKTSGSESSRPSPVPSSRPSGEGNIPRQPQKTASGPKNGEDGDLAVANSRVKCGRVQIKPAPLITHGQNTARGQWPWHIALYRIEGINLSYSCGGSLVSPTVVITAAHCVTKAPRDRPVDADILVVQLGKYHLYQFSDDSVQNKQVKDVYVHPRYNSTNYLDDLAVLVLSSPAEFTVYVRPVCLWPKHNFDLPSIDNKEGTVVGWGYDENNQVTEELKMARMPIVSYVTCLKSYPQFFSQFTAENKTFCAGFRQGTSVCNGDSGGGMVFQQDGVWYLRGLVSITVAKQGLRVCDTNHYVVFTDIANYLDWISQFLSS